MSTVVARGELRAVAGLRVTKWWHRMTGRTASEGFKPLSQVVPFVVKLL